MEEITYSVPGVSCAHCEQAIAAAVRTLTGVAAVRVDLDGKTVVVTGTDLEDVSVRAAIAEAGYEAV
jgi:copper chaperone